MKLYLDPFRQEIESFSNAKESFRASRQAFSEFSEISRKCCDSKDILNGSIVSAEDAHALLQDIKTTFIEHLKPRINGYSALRWLFMLRRVPTHVFAGDLATTAAYDSALAEVLSAKSDHSEDYTHVHGVMGFRVDDNCVRRLLRLCEGARVIGRIHSELRWCAKGADLKINNDWIPQANESPELKQDVVLYDKRCETLENIFSRTGTSLLTPHFSSDSAILIAQRIRPIPLQLSGEDIFITMRFLPRMLSVSELKNLTRTADDVGSNPWPIEAHLATWVARAVCLYYAHQHRDTQLRMQILNTGYLLVTEQVFCDWVLQVADDCNAFVRGSIGVSLEIKTSEELLSLSSRCHGQEWPLLPIDMLRRLPGLVCVDLVAIGNAIEACLEYSEQTGSTANVRSKHFEEVVQKLVDKTKWCPVGVNRTLLNRTLRKNGKEITDLDAVGVRGSTLFLISCKSKVKGKRYDAGEYSVVRNSVTELTKAVGEWDQFIRNLRMDPTGDNFDFSIFTKIIGVVCTSCVFYGPIALFRSDSTEKVVALAIHELEAWLTHDDHELNCWDIPSQRSV